MELLSYYAISAQESTYLSDLISYFVTIPVDDRVSEQTIVLRKKYRLKLPDSIICATELLYKLVLITADQQLESISELNIILYRSA
jgi:predicted nucleic acid-binding protein